MTTLTDPAREYAELCEALSSSGSKTGDDFLAAQFSVGAWSPEFFQIIFTILDRGEKLKSIVGSLALDSDVITEAYEHISATQRAFNKSSLANTWHMNGGGATLLSSVNVQPIKMLSGMIRQTVSYPKLSAEDCEDLLKQVSILQVWLTEHQLAEQDFIRQLILDGISQFSFRLSKLRWLGYGYTMSSLKDVIAAYMALEGASAGPVEAPDAEAVLLKTGAVLRSIFAKIGVAKDVLETGDFMLRALGAVSLIQHGTTVAGLLTYMGGAASPS